MHIIGNSMTFKFYNIDPRTFATFPDRALHVPMDKVCEFFGAA
jgi:hypothetical protein